MEVLNQIFEILTKASSELPKIQVGTFFIISMCAVVLLGIIVGLTYLGSSAAKFRRACQKVVKYLASVDEINDDNAENFTATCFGKSAPESLRNAWLQYLGVRFGYPSDIISESTVFDKEVKRTRNVRANVFIGIALIVVAVLAFWSLGSNPSVEMGAIVALGLIVAGVIYLIFTAVAKKQFSKARDLFYEMEDDLDAKVDFHVEKDYAMDSSPLLDIVAVLDEIIAKNTAKVVDYDDVKREVEEKETKAEEIAENEELVEAEENTETVEKVSDETVETEETPEEVPESTPIEELIEDAPEETEEISEVENAEVPDEVEESDEIEENEVAPENEEVAEETAEAETEETTEIEEPADDTYSASEEEIDPEFSVDEEPPVDDELDDKPKTEEEALQRISEMLSGAKPAVKKNESTSKVMKQEGVGDWLAGQNEFAMATPVEAFEEVNIEDEKVMFGKKKKEALKAQQAAEQAQKEQQVFLDSELVEEEEVLQEVEEAPVAAAPEMEVVPVSDNQELPKFERTVITNAPVTALDPEVVEEYEDLDEGDEDVKAPRLSKLPHLVDYVLTMNVSKSTKIKVAQLMFQAYAVFKNSPENKAIVMQCIGKIMNSISAEMKK